MPQIMSAIEKGKACAASDAAMNDARMGGHYIIIDLESKIRLQNSFCHNR